MHTLTILNAILVLSLVMLGRAICRRAPAVVGATYPLRRRIGVARRQRYSGT